MNNFARIPGTPIQSDGKSGSGSGLGGAGMLDWQTGVHVLWIGSAIFMLVL